MYLGKWDGEVKQEPNVDHIDIKCLWEGVGHADKPDGGDGPSTQSTHTNIRKQEHTYIDVKTNIPLHDKNGWNSLWQKWVELVL